MVLHWIVILKRKRKGITTQCSNLQLDALRFQINILFIHVTAIKEKIRPIAYHDFRREIPSKSTKI